MNQFQRGNQFLVCKQYESALRCFLEHADAVPSERADALAAAAECYRRSPGLHRPVDLDEKLLVSRPNQQSAEHYYRLALQVDPRHLRSLRGMSDVLPDKSDERLAVLELAAEVGPGTITLIDLGDFYRTHRKDYESAYRIYRRAQSHAPRDETAYRRLNDICRRLERPDEAKDWSARWAEAKSKKHNVGPNA